MHKTLDIISVPVKSSANTINKMIEINGCIKSNDKNIFSHALKNQELELFINVRKANGVSNIKTFTITYLKAYVNNKLIKLIDVKLFIKPSKEKTLRLVESVVIIEFRFSISAEKEISSLRANLPTSLIESEIKDVKCINNSHM